MRYLALPALLAGAAFLSGCATVATTTAANGPCGTYGYVDVNNDGFISGDEWNTYRTTTYGSWDVNHDGRIGRDEFQNCYQAGGFYREAYYKPDYWTNYWTSFDANGDGYLSNDEYWSAAAWARADRNGNGRIDSDEWVWWGN
ncbi:MAG: EF-hand domain-containing protein [Sphingomicrobium sp.]